LTRDLTIESPSSLTSLTTVKTNLGYEHYCEPSASSSSLSGGADSAFDVLDTRARIETDNSA